MPTRSLAVLPSGLALTLALVLSSLTLGPAWGQNSPVIPRASVTTHPWAEVKTHPTLRANAQVLARNAARLSAEVGGVLKNWRADVGSVVASGEVMAQVDDTDLALAVDRARAGVTAAQAKLSLSQAQLKRTQALQAQGFVSPEALNQRQTEVQLIEADLAQLQLQLKTAERQQSKSVLRAPFAGQVTERMAQQGETVSPGQALFVLTQLGQAEVQALVNRDDLASLKTAKDAELQVHNLDGSVDRFPLKWLRAGQTVSGSTRQVTVRLGAAKADLPPAGTAAQLVWTSAEAHVPAPLLVRRGQAMGVFVVQAGKARFVAIPGAQEGRSAAAKLPADAILVTLGQQSLQDGDTVQ